MKKFSGLYFLQLKGYESFKQCPNGKERCYFGGKYMFELLARKMEAASEAVVGLRGFLAFIDSSFSLLNAMHRLPKALKSFEMDHFDNLLARQNLNLLDQFP